MDKYIFAATGICGNNFAEEFSKLNILIGQLNKAHDELFNYRALHIDNIMDTFTATIKEILGDQWEVNDHIRTGNGWYFFYNKNWTSRSCIHLEWSGITYDQLFSSTQYKIVLHAEGKYTKSKEVEEICNLIGTTRNKTTLYEKTFESSKSIGEMTKEEMYTFLHSVLTSKAIAQIINSIDSLLLS